LKTRARELVSMKFEYESNEERIDEFKELADLLLNGDRDHHPPVDNSLDVHSEEMDVVLLSGDLEP
jgi:hypothetical protein